MPKPKTVAGTASDPTVRYTKIELDGESYSLCYDFNAIATAEALTGTNLLQAINLSGMTATQMRGLFYATLLKAHPKTTVEDVSKLMSLANLAKITQAIVDTWTASLPDVVTDPNDETPAQSD
jgi:hypothetical protein